EFYAASEGREAAILVALNLGGQPEPTTPPVEPAAPPVASGVAQLVAIDESSLALVGSLLIVTIQTPSEESGAAPEIAAPTISTPVGLGQRSESQTYGNGEEIGEDGAAAGDGLPTETAPAHGPMTWERFVLGTDQALERYAREHREKTAPEPRDQPLSRPT